MKTVDFDLAVRLDKLGYNGSHLDLWIDDGSKYKLICDWRMYILYYKPKGCPAYKRPYLEEIAEWLREKHGIFVWVTPRKQFGREPIEYEGNVVLRKNIGIYCTKITLNTKGPDYDITLEATIKQVLDLMENKQI